MPQMGPNTSKLRKNGEMENLIPLGVPMTSSKAIFRVLLRILGPIFEKIVFSRFNLFYAPNGPQYFQIGENGKFDPPSHGVPMTSSKAIFKFYCVY